ncbi:MAG: hypothetical protein NC131_21965, partial [Roseburia sp.]|nr:hypothetical protein [Roseburia sp.]
AIFGKERDYVVPRDGLYIMTSDYGVDEEAENRAFEGCSKMLVPVGNKLSPGDPEALPAYWAEAPLVPDGFDEDAPKPAAPGYTLPGEPTDQDLCEMLENDPVAMGAYRGLMGHYAGNGPVPMPGGRDGCDLCLCGAVYSLTPRRVASHVLSVWNLAKKIGPVTEEDAAAFHGEIQACRGDSAKTTAVWDRFKARFGINGREAAMALQHLDFLNDRHKGFYQARDRILSNGGLRSLWSPGVVLDAYGATKAPIRIARTARLAQLGAPEIILVNELRLAVEFRILAKEGACVTGITDKFAGFFGINPDGTRSDKCSGMGDLELEALYEPGLEADGVEQASGSETEGFEPDDPEDTGSAPCYSDKNCGNEPGSDPCADCPCRKRWTCTYMPNFMMRQAGCTVFDNLENKYLRDGDGNIQVFGKYPKELLDRLNSQEE